VVALLCASLTHAQTDAPAGAAPAAAAIDLPAPAEVRPVAVEADGLDLENADRLKGLKSVVLAGVALYVITEASGSANAGAVFRDRSMAYVSTSLKVTGLDPARLQALADAAYDQTVAALKARGLEVVTAETYKAGPEYAELVALGDKQPLPIDAAAGKGLVFSAHGLPLFHLDEQAWLPRAVGGLFGAKVDDPYVSLGDKVGGGFRRPKIEMAFERISKSTGAAVVMGRLVLAAAQVKASGGAFALTASTSTRDSLVMPTWTNRLWVRTAGGDRGRVSLKFPLVSETAPGQIVDVTSTATKVGDAAATLLSVAAALSGVGRAQTSSTKELEMRTSPAWFDAVARPQMGAAIDALAKGLAP
jgi:hypothetical protein